MSEIIHREPNYQWGVAFSQARDEWDDPVYYLIKGTGFINNIVATFESQEEAEEVAIAMNYWETRPI